MTNTTSALRHEPITAIILAAGQGMRLRPLTETTPKCLLEVSGTPILRRQLNSLRLHGIANVIIVTGFMAETVENFSTSHFPEMKFVFVRNPRFHETNTLYSLALASKFIPQNSRVLQLNGDVVFDPRILGLLKNTKSGKSHSATIFGKCGEEEIKIATDNGAISAMNKRVEKSHAVGEAVGINMFSGDFWHHLARHLTRLQEKAKNDYFEYAVEHAIADGGKLLPFDIKNFNAIEIDFPEDLKRAENIFSTEVSKKSFLQTQKPEVRTIIAPVASSKSFSPLFSVIIPTFNRSQSIRNTLDSLFRQKTLNENNAEIIIVNDGSTDETEVILMSYLHTPRPIPITFISLSQNYGPATARNAGVLHARGKYIAFTDDDCLVPENWLKVFHEEFERDGKLAGVGGNKKPMTGAGLPTIFDIYLYLRRLPVMRERFKSAAYHPKNNCGDTANVCYRADALKKIGGFNPEYRYLEDWELKVRMHKAGYPLLYNPENTVAHFGKTGLLNFIQHIFMFGKEAKKISIVHSEIFFFNPSLGSLIRQWIREQSFLTKELKFEYENSRHRHLLAACAILAYGLLFLGANKTRYIS